MNFIVINLNFDYESLTEALNHTNIGEGTSMNPISLDVFVKNNLNSFLHIQEGEDFGLSFNFEANSLQPEFCFLKFRNITKNHNNFMSLQDWQNYFEIDANNKDIVVAPDGSLYIKPTITNGEQKVEIKSKQPSISNFNDIYLAYTVVLFLYINNIKYFFKIDPLVRISSKPR